MRTCPAPRPVTSWGAGVANTQTGLHRPPSRARPRSAGEQCLFGNKYLKSDGGGAVNVPSLRLLYRRGDGSPIGV